MAVNQDLLARAQALTASRGLQITPTMWQQIGGSLSDYPRLYGASAFYDAQGNLTPFGQQNGALLPVQVDQIAAQQLTPTPAPPPTPQPRADGTAGSGQLNITAFHDLQRRTEQEGRQITPEEWAGLGGDLNQYEQLYAHKRWFNRDGSTTEAGQAAGVSSVGNPDTRPRDPVTGNRIDPTTGTHFAGPGYPISPVVDFSTAQGATAAQDAYSRINIANQNLQNRIGVQGPTGSSFWKQDPTTGQYTLVNQLDPWQTRRYGQEQETAFKAGTEQSKKLDEFARKGEYSLGGISPTLTQEQLAGERRHIEQQLLDNFAARMEPQFEREQQQLMQSFADRGLPLNSERARIEQENLSRRHNDARREAQTQATQLGGQELSRTYGISSDIRNRGVGEYEKSRYAPFVEAQYAGSLMPQIQLPQSAPIPSIGVPGVDAAGIGLGYNAQALSRYQTDLNAQLQREAMALKGAGGGGSGFDPNVFDFVSTLPPVSQGDQGTSDAVSLVSDASTVAGNLLQQQVIPRTKQYDVWGNQLSSNPWGGRF